MKLSTKSRYGLRLIVDIAAHAQTRPVSLKEVSRREEISVKYLEQIISMLNKGGFVRSIRGAQGGYQLCCDPRSTTVGSILRALEGSMCPVECVDGEEIRCERAAGCVTVGVWRKLCRAIEDVIDSITLADLVDEYNEKGALNYSI